MKKVVISLVLLFAVVMSAGANNPDKLIAQLSKESNATNVKIGGFLMAIAKPFMEKEAGEAMPLVKGIKSIHVLAVDGCSESQKNNYVSLINSIKDEGGYETIVQVNDADSKVRIMLKTEKDKVKGMYIFCVDDSDIAVVKLLGNIKEKDIQELIEKYSKND
ncbi:DUF4252 domain-containing protein [Dysgonomonas sp. 25]|uniref:DUF4252 domain-containing protein n=1 Tax=Dysgonomonas sp. 25 TaxID=2302933 RepID=UPI0013D09831|nr:DUF4252 domain-containing protein [Dysgonomonas sp. 25]NDV67339.1 DUF4252 domain-containing protein [Dysgonomonas sp. 25]